MTVTRIAAAVIATGLLACGPAFAQTSPSGTDAVTADKQAAQSLAHGDFTKQQAQSLSHGDIEKQPAQSLSHGDPSEGIKH
jgi:hypothetical protein